MDYNNLELSIIIPVYNMEKYICRCLDSVEKALSSITERVEVLIINDGSVDNSEKLITEYCKKNKYMKLYNKANGGLSDVKNYGLERATGEYIIFLDSDDFVHPDIYVSMLKKAREENADVVVCDIQLTYDDASKNQIHPCAVAGRNDIFSKVIDMTMMPASWNKIVKKDLYDGLTFPVGKNNEDVAVTPLILAKAKKIAVVYEPYYMYYQRNDSIQNSTFNEKRFVILDTAKLCVDRLNDLGIDENKKDIIKGSVYLHQVLAIALYPIRREKFKSRYNMLKTYMPRCETLFPDLWDNSEIKEFVNWDSLFIQWSKKFSVFLLKRHCYFFLSIYWGLCNVIFDLGIRIKN